MFLIPLISSLSSVNYKFNSTYEGINLWAYNSSKGCNQFPPYSLTSNCSLIDMTYNPALDVRDDFDQVISFSPLFSSNYTFTLFKAYTPIPKKDIISFNWNWTGDRVTDTNVIFHFYVWNSTNNSFSFNSFRSNESLPVTFNWSVSSSDINDLVNDTGYSHLLVITNSTPAGGSNTRIETDFVEFTMSYYTSPNVYLKYPTNNSYLKNRQNYFNCSYTDDSTLKNATLYIYNNDGTFNSTNTTLISGSSNVTNLSMSILDGKYKYNCIAFNTDGRSSWNNTNYTFTIDTTNPQIVFGQGTSLNGSNMSGSNIYLNMSVIETNEANITFTLYNSTKQINITTYQAGNRTINWTNLNDGVYYYNVSIRDLANNLNFTETRTITLDTLKSGITISFPTNTTYSTNVSYINYSYSDINPGSCWYSRNNGVTNSTQVVAGTNFSSVTSIEGSNNWTVYCNDSSGNLNSSTIYFFKDSVYPYIKIQSPSNNTNTSDSQIDLNYSVSDTNLESCFYSNNFGIINTSISCGTNFTDTTWSEGWNTIFVYANDTLGNINRYNFTNYNFHFTYLLSIFYLFY